MIEPLEYEARKHALELAIANTRMHICSTEQERIQALYKLANQYLAFLTGAEICVTTVVFETKTISA